MKLFDDISKMPFSVAFIGWGFLVLGLQSVFGVAVMVIMIPVMKWIMPGYLERVIEAANNPVTNFFMDHWGFSIVYAIVLTILMLVGAINFLRRRLWAKRWVEILCWYIILLNLVNMYFLPRMDFSKILPVMPNNAPAGIADQMYMSASFGMAVGVMFSVGYTILLIGIAVYLHSRKVKNVFQSA
jgi:hypothetical protein